ncbi:prepilin-type N-terminal cleavage/methylation domain-containing protein [Aliikangiella marina]|nr:prepilin-type N-terminal cleavage/methylation domain-containing protein [Aliikangiella marina]
MSSMQQPAQLANKKTALRRTSKPPAHQAAFTLVELIVVIAILAIIVAYIGLRPNSSSDYSQDAVAEQIIAAGRLTQQLAMNDSARAFTLALSANQINLLADGAAFAAGGFVYPVAVDPQLTISPVSNITFDRLGQTAAATITITGDSTAQVCFEASGLIRRC